MGRNRLTRVLLWTLPFLGLLALYNCQFAVWMTAHPLYDSSRWRIAVGIYTVILLAIAVTWAVVWRRSRRKA